MVPADLSYRESIVGTTQIFDVRLPRVAFNSVLSGLDDQNLESLYREPLAALQNNDIHLPEQAEFAYYSIRSLFVLQVLSKPTDPWLVVNQALSAIGEDKATAALDDAVGAIG
jgi:hypothetical protein